MKKWIVLLAVTVTGNAFAQNTFENTLRLEDMPDFKANGMNIKVSGKTAEWLFERMQENERRVLGLTRKVWSSPEQNYSGKPQYSVKTIKAAKDALICKRLMATNTLGNKVVQDTFECYVEPSKLLHDADVQLTVCNAIEPPFNSVKASDEELAKLGVRRTYHKSERSSFQGEPVVLREDTFESKHFPFTCEKTKFTATNNDGVVTKFELRGFKLKVEGLGAGSVNYRRSIDAIISNPQSTQTTSAQ